MNKNPRLTLEDSTMDAIVKMSDGNPGAVTVIGQLLTMEPADGLIALLHLDDMQLYGSDIWVAYKDVCGQDIKLFYQRVCKRTGLVDEVTKLR